MCRKSNKHERSKYDVCIEHLKKTTTLWVLIHTSKASFHYMHILSAFGKIFQWMGIALTGNPGRRIKASKAIFSTSLNQTRGKKDLGLKQIAFRFLLYGGFGKDLFFLSTQLFTNNVPNMCFPLPFNDLITIAIQAATADMFYFCRGC